MTEGRRSPQRPPARQPGRLFAGRAAPAVCPYLGGLDELAEGEPSGVVRDGARCTASWPWLPLGRLQQETVCLTAAYESCPRFQWDRRYGPAGPPRRRRLPFGLRLAAIVIAVALVAGGLALGAGAALGPLAGFLASGPAVSPSAGTAAPPSPPAESIAPTIPPTMQPTAAPTPSLSPSPLPTPSPTPTPPALPTPPPGSPYATLAPCPNGEYCYIYVVRSGDTLWSIADHFGTTVPTIHALNPELGTSSLIVPGQELKLPPPTR